MRAVIDQEAHRPSFRELLLQFLSAPGRVLSPGGSVKWPAFVLHTCRSLGGDPTAAVGAAAAVEFIIASADVVDDLVDDDLGCGRVEWNRTLNASHGLTWLAHRCVCDLTEVLGPERACLIGRLISEQAVRSCSGEDLDLTLEDDWEVTAEATLEMTEMKSGSLVAMACQVGASIATEDHQVVSLVGEIGQHAGVVAQLLNDVGGVMSGNDLRRRKKTLPIAYALRCAREEGVPEVIDWFSSRDRQDASGLRRVSEIIQNLGALHYALVVAAGHRHEALELVRELVRVTGRPEAGDMRRLVPQVWARKARQVFR